MFISAKSKFKHRQKSSSYFGFASLSVSNSRSQVPEQSLDFRANVLLFLKTSVFWWGFSNSWFQKWFYHILSIPYGTNMYQPHLFSTSCEPVRTHDQPRFPPAPSSVEFRILSMSLRGKYAKKSSRVSSQKTLAKDTSGETLATDHWTCILGRKTKTTDSAEIWKTQKHIAQNMIYVQLQTFVMGVRRIVVHSSSARPLMGNLSFEHGERGGNWSWKWILNDGTEIKETTERYVKNYSHTCSFNKYTQENNQLFLIQPNPAQLPAVPKKNFIISLYTYLSGGNTF